jgi:hypothetical protein
MTVQERDGVRTFRRDFRSIELARAIHVVLRSRTELYLVDLAKELGESYQTTERVLPFEIGGMVYLVVSETQTRVYQKSKKVVAKVGKLEDYAPRRPAPKTTLDRKIETKLAEIEKFVNLFALREEARRYIDARLEVIEARLMQVERESIR